MSQIKAVPLMLAVFLLALASSALADNGRGTGLGLGVNAGITDGTNVKEYNEMGNQGAGVHMQGGVNMGAEVNQALPEPHENGNGLKLGVMNNVVMARANYEHRQEDYNGAMHAYAEARADEGARMHDFLVARASLRSAVSQEERDRHSEEVRESARLVLLDQVNAVLARIQAQSASDVNSQVDTDLNAFFREQQSRLEDQNVSKEELIRVSADMREYVKEHGYEFRRGELESLQARIDNITRRAQSFSEKLSAAVKSLAQQGKDVNLLLEGQARLQADLNAFTQASADLNAMYHASSASNQASLDEAQALVRAMYAQLQEDFGLIKGLVKATIELEEKGSVSVQTASDLNAATHMPGADRGTGWRMRTGGMDGGEDNGA